MTAPDRHTKWVSTGFEISNSQSCTNSLHQRMQVGGRVLTGVWRRPLARASSRSSPEVRNSAHARPITWLGGDWRNSKSTRESADMPS